MLTNRVIKYDWLFYFISRQKKNRNLVYNTLLCSFTTTDTKFYSIDYTHCEYALIILGIYLFGVYYIMDIFYNKNASQR